MARRATDKRQRLVAAAMIQFHVQGLARTSLTDVARAADIPVGNVFYYFKAKDDLVRAVVDETCRLLSGYLRKLESAENPLSRIVAFIDTAVDLGEMYVALGCPLAALARDLRLEGGVLSADAGRIYAVQERWLESQFIAIGVSNSSARAHTHFLMAGYHGAILLAHSQGEQHIINGQAEDLKYWLKTIAHV